MKTPTCSVAKRHSWKPVGGCRENPGYMGIGGTAICYSETCVHCHVNRSKVFGDININGNRNCGFRYN